MPRRVNGRHPVEHALHSGRQPVVGHVLVGEHRIAAIGRGFQAVKDRAERRLLQVGHVRMPATAEVLGVALVLGDHDDLRVAVHRLDEVVHVQRAKPAAERNVLLRGHLLVAEEDGAVIEQCLVNQFCCAVVEFPAQIDSFDHRPKRATDRLHCNILSKRH